MGEILTVFGVFIGIIGGALIGYSIDKESFGGVISSGILAIIGCSLFICGLLSPENSWECCDKTIYSEYCCECGRAKPVECKNWTCCNHERDKDIKFCPDCGKARPTVNDTTNNIIVKDNENVEVNVNPGGVVIIEDDVKDTETNNDASTTVPDADT